jgi:hypothetical protein
VSRGGSCEYQSREPDSDSYVDLRVQGVADRHEERLHQEPWEGADEGVVMRVADHLARRQLVRNGEVGSDRIVVDNRLA